MIAVYYNYPNNGFTIHKNCSVLECQTHGKTDQRVLYINIDTTSERLKNFQSQEHKFRSVQELNDMWLEIDFGNNTFEIAIAEYILFLLGTQYKPFHNVML